MLRFNFSQSFGLHKDIAPLKVQARHRSVCQVHLSITRAASRTAIILRAFLHGVKCFTTIMDHAGAMASRRLDGGRYVPTANGRSKDALE